MKKNRDHQDEQSLIDLISLSYKRLQEEPARIFDFYSRDLRLLNCTILVLSALFISSIDVYYYFIWDVPIIDSLIGWLIGIAGATVLIEISFWAIAKSQKLLEHEITARQQAEEALSKSETSFHAMFNNAPVGISICDLQGHFLETNPALQQLMGYSSYELSRMRFADVTHPDDEAHNWQLFNNLLEGKCDHHKFSKRYIRGNGQIVWVNLSISLVRDDDNQPLFTIGIVEDVSERKWAEETLRETERRLHQVTDTVDQYIYSFNIDKDGNFSNPLISPSVTNFTGHSPEEHRADYYLWINSIHPDDREIGVAQFQDIVDQSDQGENSHSLTYRIVDTQGRVHWVKDDMHISRDPGGTIMRLDGVVTDITALKEAQSALEERNRSLRMANERLKELDRLKSNFLANMSHELRTPLNSIIGFAQILDDQLAGELNEQQHEFVEDINASGQHLLTLINDLLDLSKIEAGRLEIRTELFDFASLAQETADVIRRMTDAKQQTLDLEIPPNVESISADRFRIKQVLLNLLSNANKFTPNGGDIKLKARIMDETALLVSVSDTGIGIPEEDLDSIFNEFQQVDSSTTREAEGTGLGLSISRRLIEMHSGKLWAESKPGEGSIFSFLLPLAGPPPTATNVIAKSAITISLPKDHEALVMVIEDDRRFANMLSFYFNREGFNVAQLFNGQQVMEYAHKLKPCLITLDLMLPDIDGWQILRQLKDDSQTAGIPVVVITALDEGETSMGKWQALGAVDYIVKPLDRDELQRLLALVHLDKKDKPQVLVFNKNDEVRRFVDVTFPEDQFIAEYLTDGKNAYSTILAKQPDVLVMDIDMPGLEDKYILEQLRQHPGTEDLPIMVLTSKELEPERENELMNIAQAVIRYGSSQQLSNLIREIKNTQESVEKERFFSNKKVGID